MVNGAINSNKQIREKLFSLNLLKSRYNSLIPCLSFQNKGSSQMVQFLIDQHLFLKVAIKLCQKSLENSKK